LCHSSGRSNFLLSGSFSSPAYLAFRRNRPPWIMVSRQDGVEAQLLEGISAMLRANFAVLPPPSPYCVSCIYGSSGKVFLGFCGPVASTGVLHRGLLDGKIKSRSISPTARSSLPTPPPFTGGEKKPLHPPEADYLLTDSRSIQLEGILPWPPDMPALRCLPAS
jgi:hypothetical protein